MATAGVIRGLWPDALSIDIGWRNVVYALRTAVAGLVALAIAYWLGLQDPQWSILTVYLLAQPTAGASIAKGFYRIAGTIAGAIAGLVAVALYAEAPVALVGCLAVWYFATTYAATRARYFAAYGVLLAGFTALLVGFEGAAAPTTAWTIALDRSTEIILGILCSTAASVLVMPRYASDVLRAALYANVSGLAAFGVAALQPGTPFDTLMRMRWRMVVDVVKFDALRSYTAFEGPDRRVDDETLHRALSEFLAVLAVVRGLYVRLEDIRGAQDGAINDRLEPAIRDVQRVLRTLSDDLPRLRGAREVRQRLRDAHRDVAQAAADLEGHAGTCPLEPLANALLILRRTGEMVHGLAMVMTAEAASMRAAAHPKRGPGRSKPRAPVDDREAILQGLRASLGLVAVALFWSATTWTAGFSALEGFGIMIFFAINQDDPARIGLPYTLFVACGLVMAYAYMVLVLPSLEGFLSLSLALMIVLVPAGLVMGTPRYAFPGAGFTSFFVAYMGSGNVYRPEPGVFANSALGLLFGFGIGLVFFNLVPVTSRPARRRALAAGMRRLAAVAGGRAAPRRAHREALEDLAALLPRLDLDRPGDETFLRGSLGVASSCLELGLLRRFMSDPAMPPDGRRAIDACLNSLAAAFAMLADAPADADAVVSRAEAAVAETRARLAEVALEPASDVAASVLRAASSLRFIADRFGFDRPYLLRAFPKD